MTAETVVCQVELLVLNMVEAVIFESALHQHELPAESEIGEEQNVARTSEK